MLMLVHWKRVLVVALILIAALAVGVSWSGADEDQESAPKVGEVATLRSLLALVHKTHPGQILEVELEQEEFGEKNIWIYEVKILSHKGRVYELEYDASTLELLDTEGLPHRR
jgi:uncharacterized membrane protein YkoI